MTNNKTLSVAMINYNHGNYIEKALLAIVNQSYKPSEVIVVDDGSTDNSVEIIHKTANLYPFIQLERNVVNRGPMRAAAKCFQLARGDYIYAASADDMVLPGLFEESILMLDRYPEAGFCFSDAVLSDHRTGIMTVDRLNLSDKPMYLSPEDLVRIMSRRHVHIWGHTSIYKREALRDAGDWIPELKWDVDRFAAYVIGFRHGACYIPKPLASYRRTPSSYSASSSKRPDIQRQVLISTFNTLLKPSYEDVRLQFKRTAVFYTYGLEALRQLVLKRQFRIFLSYNLVRRALWWEFRRRVSAILPFSFKQFFRSFRHKPLSI